MAEQIEASLRPCPTCREPLRLLDGLIQLPDDGAGDITLWTEDGVDCITPHAAGCEMTGKPLPAFDFGVGPYEQPEE